MGAQRLVRGFCPCDRGQIAAVGVYMDVPVVTTAFGNAPAPVAPALATACSWRPLLLVGGRCRRGLRSGGNPAAERSACRHAPQALRAPDPTSGCATVAACLRRRGRMPTALRSCRAAPSAAAAPPRSSGVRQPASDAAAALDRRDIPAGVRHRHEGVPGRGRQAAAGDVLPFSHMGRKSSCPTQTPVTSAPVKPTNQASRQPELVPVLPDGMREVENGAPPGAFVDHRLHHLVHLLDDARADDLRRLAARRARASR